MLHQRPQHQLLAIPPLAAVLVALEVAKQLFRFGSIESLPTRLEIDGKVLAAIVCGVGLCEGHIQLAEAIHQPSDHASGDDDIALWFLLRQADELSNAVAHECSSPPLPEAAEWHGRA